ncbi:hypothetical protein L3X38_011827 [Prunus dulcis]|uniref:Uncharacterized protein n=1 Tax=Prunus dulcis TaxID=3755 RepID=A0AAD4WKK0_PRUDU|nr:hypothetical protein L3X38_011827 [Prunus dulcis]
MSNTKHQIEEARILTLDTVVIALYLHYLSYKPLATKFNVDSLLLVVLCKYTWQDFGAKLQETDKPSSDCLIPAQKLSDGCSGGNKVGSGNEFIEEPLKRIWRSSDLDSMLDEKENVYEYENHPREYFSLRQSSRM